MPKVSDFTQLPFPLPSSNLTCQGEQKVTHPMASRVLWEGGYFNGDGSRCWVTDAPTVYGSTVIPANFFSTYRRLTLEAAVLVPNTPFGANALYVAFDFVTAGGVSAGVNSVAVPPVFAVAKYRFDFYYDAGSVNNVLDATVGPFIGAGPVQTIRWAPGNAISVNPATAYTFRSYLEYATGSAVNEPTCLYARLTY